MMNVEVCGKCPIYNDGLLQLGIRHNVCGAPRYVSNPGKRKGILVAEAFGQDEDIINSPLVGRSGKLLGQLLTESGLDQFDLKLDNAVKCRPIKLESGKYKNRTPTDEEIACCRPYLTDTLAFEPDLIITLGRIPTKTFFPDKDPSMIRGKAQEYIQDNKKYVVVPSIHPAYCLYQNSNTPTLLKHLTGAVKYLKGLDAA